METQAINAVKTTMVGAENRTDLNFHTESYYRRWASCRLLGDRTGALMMQKATTLVLAGAIAIAATSLYSPSLYGQGKKGGGDAAKGKTVFEQCAVCHDAESNDAKIGPGLKGLFKGAKLPSGKATSDANVMTQINDGGNGMPAYKDILSAPEKADLLAYLKTL
jgi:mono/diheme cytochrome c family protein